MNMAYQLVCKDKECGEESQLLRQHSNSLPQVVDCFEGLGVHVLFIICADVQYSIVYLSSEYGTVDVKDHCSVIMFQLGRSRTSLS